MNDFNILAIGNSFSTDSTHYIHQIAEAGGVEVKVVNLYIGGCPLERHWQNIQADAAAYRYELNGIPTERMVSIREALEEENWDFIVTHQASHDSGLPETYRPYARLVTDYVRNHCPKARLYLQKTWAYEIDSNHPEFSRYHKDQAEMYRRLSEAYEGIARELELPLIPSGDIIQEVRGLPPFRYQEGGRSLCRDGYHMDYLYGRYLLGAAWVEALLQKDIRSIDYLPQTPLVPVEAPDPAALQVIRETVHKICHGGDA